MNLSYTSPHEDLERCARFSVTGRIDVANTMRSLREILQSNINVIDGVIENASRIRDLEITGINEIQIIADAVTLSDLANQDLTMVEEEQEEEQQEQEAETDNTYFEDEETHSQRLEKIKRLSNVKEFSLMRGSELNEDDELSEISDDEVFDDEDFRKKIKEKYQNMTASYEDDDYSD